MASNQLHRAFESMEYPKGASRLYWGLSNGPESDMEVARRIIWVSHWGLWDSVLFHGDPHPANIVVQRNSRLVSYLG